MMKHVSVFTQLHSAFAKYIKNYHLELSPVISNYGLFRVTSIRAFLGLDWVSRLHGLRTVIIQFFTKITNPGKLYIEGGNGIFLSPGIVLRFLRLHRRRSLRKRKRIWLGSIRALLRLVRRPSILMLANLFGKQASIFDKLISPKFPKVWIFVRLFFLYLGLAKRRRRIKRWVKKRYFQLGIEEER